MNGGKLKDMFGFGGSGKLILNPRELNPSNCNVNLNFDYSIITLNEANIFNQLKSTYISIFNSFLSKHNENFQGKVFNLIECPPGFEGSFCKPCKFGYFKPFYGSRQCVKCPCRINENLNPSKIIIF
jgi:hypothetical protein